MKIKNNKTLFLLVYRSIGGHMISTCTLFFYGLHNTTHQICIIPLYECFINIITI